MFFSAQVRSSQVEGGGEGLYARRNLAKGEIVAFYNGVSTSIFNLLNQAPFLKFPQVHSYSIPDPTST